MSARLTVLLVALLLLVVGLLCGEVYLHAQMQSANQNIKTLWGTVYAPKVEPTPTGAVTPTAVPTTLKKSSVPTASSTGSLR